MYIWGMILTEKPSDIASEVQSELYIQRMDMVLTMSSKDEVDTSPHSPAFRLCQMAVPFCFSAHPLPFDHWVQLSTFTFT
jgi:hypothetical protein